MGARGGLVGAPLAGLVLFLTHSRAGLVGAAAALVVGVAAPRHRWTTLVHGAVAATVGFVLVAHAHRSIAEGKRTNGAGAVAAALLVAMAACALAAASPWSRRLDRVRAPRRWPRRAVALAAIVVAAAAVVPLAGPAWTSFTEPERPTPHDPVQRLGNLGGNRDEIWSAAIDAFEAHPLCGAGAGTFELWFSRHGGETSLKDAHSLVLEPLAELGVAGPIAVVLFLGGLLNGAWRARVRAPDAAMAGACAAGVAVVVLYAVHAGADWIWECTAVTALAVVAATAAAGETSRTGQPLPLWARAGAAAGAIPVIAVLVPAISSQRLLRESRAAAGTNDLSLALRKADAAVGAQPWAATPLAQRALVLERAGRLRGARDAIGAASSSEPTNWRHPCIAARIDAELGRPARALADLRAAQRLRPRGRFL